jgi:hypothetical protein
MLNTKQLKIQALRYAHTLQAAVKTALSFSAEHQTLIVPTQQSFDNLNNLLKQTGRFTLGFVDQQVLLNQLLTLDPSIERLKSEFLKRGIGAVTFEPGITLARYRQVISLLSMPMAALESEGGLNGFLEHHPIESVRILPAPKNQKRTEQGDTLLETDSESYLLSKNLEPQSYDLADSLDMLLESAAVEHSIRPSMHAALNEGAHELQADANPVLPGPSGGFAHPGGGGGTGHGSGGGSGLPGPHGFIDTVTAVVEQSLVDTTSNPERSYTALARILESSRLDAVLARFPQERQRELRDATPEVVAAEVFEDTALRWAKQRVASARQPDEKYVIEQDVVRVLARTIRATQTADRLASKLAKYVEEFTLPRDIYERVQDELRWTALSSRQKYDRLAKLNEFDALQFRRLLELLKDLIAEQNVDAATNLALHYAEFLNWPASQVKPEHLSRLPELVRAMSMARAEFMAAMCEKLNAALVRPDFSEFLHQQVVNALTVLSRTIAVYEEFDQVIAVGTCLERSAAADPQCHAKCCSKALTGLLPDASIERIIELHLGHKDEGGWSRRSAVLLRWSSTAGIDKAFRRLESEKDAKNRIALLRLITQSGRLAIDVAVQRMQDPRWYVVRNMCIVLGESKDPDLLAHLSPALRHPDERVQQCAAAAIMKSRKDTRGQILADALPVLHPAVRDQVLEELMFAKDPATVLPIVAYIESGRGNTEATKRGVHALVHIPHPDARHALRRIIRDTRLALDVRRLALSSLKKEICDANCAVFKSIAETPDDPLAPECAQALRIAGAGAASG